MNPTLRRAGLAIAGTAVAAGVLESLLLLASFSHPPAPDPFATLFAEGRVDGAELHVRDERELWKPIPGARVPWGGDGLDAHGFRNGPIAVERADGVARIAVLGGSAMLGRGVSREEACIQVAARELAAAGVACEAINAAVSGTTLAQGIERWLATVRPFRPDVVAAAFGADEEHDPALGASDLELIERRAPPPGVVARVARRLARESQIGQLAAWIGSGSTPSIEPQETPAAGPFDPAGEPDWPRARRMSVDDFAAGLRRLEAVVRADGARLVLVDLARRPSLVRSAPVLERYSAALREFAAERSIPLVDGKAAFAAAVRDGATYAELFNGPADPGILGHAALGRELARAIRPLLPRK